METKLLKADELAEAAEYLQGHGLVAFPTETVYGLGAIATDEQAVSKVYKAKGRPSDNPLIVHLASKEELSKYISYQPPYLDKVIDTFWPGPLTIILPLRDNVFSKTVTGGLATCAFRVPANPIAQKLISLTGPLVAPSANTSGRPSPTTANHVYEDLHSKIQAIIDGGTTEVGVESTVIDATKDDGIEILRPGKISVEELVQVAEVPVVYDKHLVKEAEIPKAPGMKYRHYAPKTPVLILRNNDDLAKAIIAYQNKKIGLLASEQLINQVQEKIQGSYSLGLEHDSKAAAHNLFAGLRALDLDEIDLIIAESFQEDDGLAKAYMNRLQKAANNQFFEA